MEWLRRVSGWCRRVPRAYRRVFPPKRSREASGCPLKLAHTSLIILRIRMRKGRVEVWPAFFSSSVFWWFSLQDFSVPLSISSLFRDMLHNPFLSEANMKQVLTILLAVVISGLTITLANALGVRVLVLGGVGYAFVEFQDMRRGCLYKGQPALHCLFIVAH
jgi:hypothetical protein